MMHILSDFAFHAPPLPLLLPLETSPLQHLSHAPSAKAGRHANRQVTICVEPSSPARRALLRILPLLPLACLPQSSSVAQARCLPRDAAQSALPPFPSEWPYTTSDFRRFDTAPDPDFYIVPRYVRHIDDRAVSALRAYYAALLPPRAQVLDLCASLESYMSPREGLNIVGLGMNADEMASNPALSDALVQDLNVNPKLPFPDKTFDFVLCALSIDYLTHPREVLADVRRVLRPEGTVVLAFSDRVFATKAVALWMSGGDIDHIYTVASFLRFAGGFSKPKVVDLSPRRGNSCTGDPLYVVTASRND